MGAAGTNKKDEWEGQNIQPTHSVGAGGVGVGRRESASAATIPSGHEYLLMMGSSSSTHTSSRALSSHVWLAEDFHCILNPINKALAITFGI